MSSSSGKSKSTAGSPPNKKRRFVPPKAVPSNLVTAADLRIQHQQVELSFVYSRPTGRQPFWKCQGRTIMYAIMDDVAEPPGWNVALHLRRTCQVQNLTVSAPGSTSNGQVVKMHPFSVSYQHADPLAHVLVKPSQSYTEDDFIENPFRRADSDSQCTRGAQGMTNGLRFSSIASNMGELRIAISDPSSAPKPKIRIGGSSSSSQQQTQPPFSLTAISKAQALECWTNDLMNKAETSNAPAKGVLQLREEQNGRTSSTREARLKLVSERLAEATLQPKGHPVSFRAMKICVDYEMDLDDAGQRDLGGIHIRNGPATPHIYTTVGVVGDHEGPRTWLPCLDSASNHHRASWELTFQVTAPLRDGLFALACGQDFGSRQAYLHDVSSFARDGETTQRAEDILGSRHVALLKSIDASHGTASDGGDGGPHVIPPDTTTIDSVLATAITCTQSWTPCPARSLGFAIGPFRILEDPEYFSVETQEDDDEAVAGESSEDEEDHLEQLEAARRAGEGIRQAYFAPFYERKYIHAEGSDMTLLPDTNIALSPLPAQDKKRTTSLDKSILLPTVGVPHRALSLMRDILAFPAYRTVSYTQIWIPGAVYGGSTSGALHCCPEVMVNSFVGGAIMDSRLLPPPGHRMPFYAGGRVVQFLQARCAIRGWITAALPLGGRDDVGFGYIYALTESFLMSLYERGHGAQGEGSAKGGLFFTKRYAIGSGLNSSNLDFLPVSNVEETEISMMLGGVVGAVPVDERNSDTLWRSASNGTESRTSSLDEYNIRQLLFRDIVDAIERGTDKDRLVPLPSMGWLGSHLSLSFLSSNATSSSEVGCGALELAHPVGGLTYRTLKSEVLRRIVEARAGVANFVRTLRAGFIAAHLRDLGEEQLKWEEKKRKSSSNKETPEKRKPSSDIPSFRPPFVVCVDELMKKDGFTHNLLARSLRILAGGRDTNLRGTQVDIEKEARSSTTHRQFVTPEGFPNSFVRGASNLCLRVGVHAESGATEGTPGAKKGIALQILAEPVIPEGGSAFGGPITVRVVENEGQLREFVRTLPNDGTRCDFGPVYLHAKPVTTARQQTAASGSVETKETKEKVEKKRPEKDDGLSGVAAAAGGIYTESFLHKAGYQAIELVRLTNRSPLLWVRIDPLGVYGGRISVFQPDACLAEQLFHDGDACAQVEAIRALAERPFRIQGSVKITTVFDVAVSELPARLIGDCLRGSPALHNALPHTPAVRTQAALCMAQWQNNKAPASKDSINPNAWVGVNLLIQYFKERFYHNGIFVPVSFDRISIKKNESEIAAETKTEGTSGQTKRSEQDDYLYVDALPDDEREKAIHETDEALLEEDEEYRVRMAVVTAIACVRAKDGMTPPVVVRFLETLLKSGDSAVGAVGQDNMSEATMTGDEPKLNPLPVVSSAVLSEALFAVCHVNVSPAIVVDPATGKQVRSKAQHPLHGLLTNCQRWVEWELYRESIRMDTERGVGSGIGGACHDSAAACAIAALSTLTILRQSTTNQSMEKDGSEVATGAQFYMNIFDEEPRRSDVTRAACAQAVACICCAADRADSDKQVTPFGLLTALEFILDRILDPMNSPGLRQTLALLMLDTCTGKVCSAQRVASIGGRNEICQAGTRFLGGPLGASNGNDNGSAILTTISESSHPAAHAVNNGARRGLRLLTKVGHPRDESKEVTIVRAARLATSLWRTINGDTSFATMSRKALSRSRDGVCAFDGHLRCSLLALWQWIWPNKCFAVMRVQAWNAAQNPIGYMKLGAHLVMKATQEEKEAAVADEAAFVPLTKVVATEVSRQQWRGEMAIRAYEYLKVDKKATPSMLKDIGDQGVGEPLPPIKRDNAYKQGGWLASTAQQRRSLALDGGTAVTKIRLSVASKG